MEEEESRHILSNVTVHGGFNVGEMSNILKEVMNNPEDNPFVGLSNY